MLNCRNSQAGHAGHVFSGAPSPSIREFCHGSDLVVWGEERGAAEGIRPSALAEDVLVQHFGLSTTIWQKTGNWGENRAL